MNILQALQGLSLSGNANAQETTAEVTPQPAAPPVQNVETVNVMASLIEKHERISNRVKNRQ